MGYNTTVIVLNDALDHIANDPEFGKTLARAISQLGSGRPGIRGIDVPACRYDNEGHVCGMHINAATVIETHHADMNAIVAVGGNCATQIGMTWGTHHKEEDKKLILQQLADELGYSLRRKPHARS